MLQPRYLMVLVLATWLVLAPAGWSQDRTEPVAPPPATMRDTRLAPLPTVPADDLFVSPDAYRARRDRLGEALASAQAMMVLRAFFDHNPHEEVGPQRQDNNTLFLTGTDLLDGQPTGAHVIVTPTGSRLVLPHERGTGAFAAMQREAIVRGGFRTREVHPLRDLDDVLARAVKGCSQVILQHDVAEEGEFRARGRGPRDFRFDDLRQRVRQVARAANTPIEIPDRAGWSATFWTMKVRGVKSEAELARLREAARITGLALREVIRHAKPGLYEGDLDWLLRKRYREHGADHIAFGPIVGSGPNSLILHYQPKGKARQMEAGDVVLIDNGAEYLGYAADFTRTFPISGSWTDAQRAQYDGVLANHKTVLAAAAPGVSVMELHRASVEHFALAFPGQDARRYFPHLLGHHVGMHVHDPVDFRAPMVAGHVYTIEPGWYDRATNIGIRIEDTYVVHADGSQERITRNDMIPFETDAQAELVGAAYRAWAAVGVTADFARIPDGESHEIFGIRVAAIADDSPFAGQLQTGDIVLAINDSPVIAVENPDPGHAWSAEVLRGDARVAVGPAAFGVTSTGIRRTLRQLGNPDLAHRPPTSTRRAAVASMIAGRLKTAGCQPIGGSFISWRDTPNGRTALVRATVPTSTDAPNGPAMVLVVPFDTPAALEDGVTWGCPDDAAIAVALELAERLAGTAHRSLELRFVSWSPTPITAPGGDDGEDGDDSTLVIQLRNLASRSDGNLVFSPTSQVKHETMLQLMETGKRSGYDRVTLAIDPPVFAQPSLTGCIDVSLPSLPGKPVEAFNADVDQLYPLTRIVRWLHRIAR